VDQPQRPTEQPPGPLHDRSCPLPTHQTRTGFRLDPPDPDVYEDVRLIDEVLTDDLIRSLDLFVYDPKEKQKSYDLQQVKEMLITQKLYKASPTWKSSLLAAPRNCCWCTRKKTRNWTPNASGSSSKPSTPCGETPSAAGEWESLRVRSARVQHQLGRFTPLHRYWVPLHHICRATGHTRNNNARVRRQHRARGLRAYGNGVLVDGPFEIRRLHFLQELLKLIHLVIEGLLQGDRLLGDRIRNEDGGFHPQRERYRIAWTGVDNQRVPFVARWISAK